MTIVTVDGTKFRALGIKRIKDSMQRRSSFFTLAIFLILAPSIAIAFEFEPVPVPDGESQWLWTSGDVRMPSSAKRQGEPRPFQHLLHSGQVIGDGTFGLLKDQNGKPISFYNGDRAAISHKIDFTSLLPAGDRLFSITHFEHGPGNLYLSEIKQSKDGQLSPLSTRNVTEIKGVDGIWYPCAGVVTAWGSHLGGEEFPPDAGFHVDAVKRNKLTYHNLYQVPAFRYYMGVKLGLLWPEVDLKTLAERFNPYRVGYVFEASVDTPAGDAPTVLVTKHYAMGRFSHEVAFVMPDDRTVYMTDDDSAAGGFFLFIADHPRDFSTGTLYAARWQHSKPDGTQGAGRADISWVSLGHSDAGDLKRIRDLIAKPPEIGLLFTDLFDQADPDSQRQCPKTFQSTNIGGPGKGECLRVKSPDLEIIASRLETRRMAAMRGATVEFSKSEGLAFDPAENRLYMSIAQIKKAMTKQKESGNVWRPATQGQSNQQHIRLKKNRCGAVYGLDLRPNADMNSDYVAINMEAVLTGKEVGNLITKFVKDNACDVDAIAGPDNLTFIPEQRLLVIAEDTDYHLNNAVWAYQVESKKLTRIQTVPQAGEATGVYYHANLNGFRYLLSAIQHPGLSNKTNGETEIGTYTGVPAAVGYYVLGKANEAGPVRK
jgi:uncharacterized protein